MTTFGEIPVGQHFIYPTSVEVEYPEQWIADEDCACEDTFLCKCGYWEPAHTDKENKEFAAFKLTENQFRYLPNYGAGPRIEELSPSTPVHTL